MKRYFRLIDMSKDNTDFRSQTFFTQSTHNDILGLITEYAKKENVDFNDLRLFEFETKKQYEMCFNDYWDKTHESYYKEVC